MRGSFVSSAPVPSVSSASMTRDDETLSEGVMVGRLGWTGQVDLTVLSSR